MSYIAVTEPQSNPFAPLTSELVKQLRDNPIAIAEGEAGAPRVQARGLAFELLPPLSESGVNPVGYTSLDPLSLYLFKTQLNNSSGSTRDFQLRASNDNGDNWGSWLSIYAVVTGSSSLFDLYVNNATGLVSSLLGEKILGVTDINAIQARASGTGMGINHFIVGHAMSRAEAT